MDQVTPRQLAADYQVGGTCDTFSRTKIRPPAGHFCIFCAELPHWFERNCAITDYFAGVAASARQRIPLGPK